MQKEDLKPGKHYLIRHNRRQIEVELLRFVPTEFVGQTSRKSRIEAHWIVRNRLSRRDIIVRSPTAFIREIPPSHNAPTPANVNPLRFQSAINHKEHALYVCFLMLKHLLKTTPITQWAQTALQQETLSPQQFQQLFGDPKDGGCPHIEHHTLQSAVDAAEDAIGETISLLTTQKTT